MRLGFEGGQTPLYRRIPKIRRPMKGHKKIVYELIKLSHLNELKDGETIDAMELRERGIISKPNKGRKIYKVVGGEELTAKNLIVKAQAFTQSAREAIEANGGQCIIMSPTRTDKTLEEMDAAREVRQAEQLAKWRELRALKLKKKLVVV